MKVKPEKLFLLITALILAFVVLAAVITLGPKQPKSPVSGEFNIFYIPHDRIIYVKDKRTGLCYSCVNSYKKFGFTNVPCTKKVEKHLYRGIE